MIGRGNRKHRILPECLTVDQGLGLAREHYRFRLTFESVCPFIGSGHMSAPGISMKIVNQIAAADDQDIFVTQRRKSPANLEMKCRGLRFINAQLNNRDVRVREYVAENRPRSVIEPPGVVQLDRDWR